MSRVARDHQPRRIRTVGIPRWPPGSKKAEQKAAEELSSSRQPQTKKRKADEGDDDDDGTFTGMDFGDDGFENGDISSQVEEISTHETVSTSLLLL